MPESTVEMKDTSRLANERSIVWTRGKGCAELADLLADGDSSRVTGDPVQTCIDLRADLLIARKFPASFDLVSVAVPVDFVPENVTRVVAAVAGGPHSELAAETALKLGMAMDVPAEMVSASQSDDDAASAFDILDSVGRTIPDLDRRVIEVDGLAELAESLEDGALLVLGAPGGSWFRRSVSGPGARLRRTAQAGSIVVRSAPDRVFRFMGDPVYVAPLRQANDTLRFHDENTLAVAHEGRLIGLVRRDVLVGAADNPVESVMEEAVSVRQDETLNEARELEPTFGHDPIPVTDDEERLVGGLLLPAV